MGAIVRGVEGTGCVGGEIMNERQHLESASPIYYSAIEIAVVGYSEPESATLLNLTVPLSSK